MTAEIPTQTLQSQTQIKTCITNHVYQENSKLQKRNAVLPVPLKMLLDKELFIPNA